MKLTYTIFRDSITPETNKDALLKIVLASKLPRFAVRESVSFNDLRTDLLNHIVLPARFKSGEDRRNDNAVESYPSILPLDFDTPDFTLEDYKHYFGHFCSIVVSSRNHQKEKNGVVCDRFHAVLILANPIESKESWKKARLIVSHMLPERMTSDSGPVKFQSVQDESLTYCGVLYPGVSVLYQNPDGDLFDPTLTFAYMRDAEIKQIPEFREGIGFIPDFVADLILDGIPPGKRDNGIFSCSSTLYNAGFNTNEVDTIITRALKKTGGDTSDNVSKLEKCLKRLVGKNRDPRFYRSRESGVVGVKRDGSAMLDESQVISEKDRLIDEICSKYLRFHRNEERTVLYTIRGDDQLTYCPNREHAYALICDDLVKTPLPAIRRMNGVNYIAYVNTKPEAVIERWLVSGEGLSEEPAEFRFKSDAGYCIHRLGFDLVPGKYPAWEDFLSRARPRDSFMAWFGAVLDMKNRGRQALWVYGPEGQDGKSAVMRSASTVFGNAAATMNTDVTNQFASSQAYKKRLIVLPDLKDTAFVKSSMFRKIVSGDPVTIERKGQDAFTAILNTKVAICSNYLPTVTSGNADLSRLLVVHVTQSPIRDDETWEDRLTAELPYFLYDCVKKYKELVPEGRALIPVSEEVHGLLKSSASSSEIKFSSIFDKFFESDDKSQMLESKVYDIVCETRFADRVPLKSQHFKMFTTYLMTSRGIRTSFDSGLGCNVIKGIRVKEGVGNDVTRDY